MRLNSRRKTIGSLGLFITALLMLTLLEACNRVDKDDATRQPQMKKGPAEISVVNGEAVLALDTATQSRLGLQVSTLTATVTRAQLTSPAVVLPIQDLAAFRNSYIAAQTQLQKSRVEMDIAHKEYTRLKALFEQDHNISEKSLQSAEGALKVSEADELAAEQQANLQKSMAHQEWGGVASKWALEDSPEFQRVLDQHDVFVQVTMQPDATLPVAKTISLEIPGAARIGASLVSPFPRVNPRIQGRSLSILHARRKASFLA